MKVLKVYVTSDTIGFEYEANPGYPETAYFSRKALGPGETKAHVRAAALKLKADVARGQELESKTADLTDLANEALKES